MTTIRPRDAVLILDRSVSAFPYSLLHGGAFHCTAAVVTSVDKQTFRGKLKSGGARIFRKDDVIATRATLEEIHQLFETIVAIGNAARRECRNHQAAVLARAEQAIQLTANGGDA